MESYEAIEKRRVEYVIKHDVISTVGNGKERSEYVEISNIVKSYTKNMRKIEYSRQGRIRTASELLNEGRLG